MEIIVGAIIGYGAFKLGFFDKLLLNADWMKFCAGIAAIMLTFLAGSELNPETLRSKFKEITIVGLVGFFAPFAGATLVAFYVLDWNIRASLLTGIALSTTSMAVVYSVMIEYGLEQDNVWQKPPWLLFCKRSWYRNRIGTYFCAIHLQDNSICGSNYSPDICVAVCH